jgi:hypothetical protein
MRVITSRTGLWSALLLFVGLLLLGAGRPVQAETIQVGLQEPAAGGEIILTMTGLGPAGGGEAVDPRPDSASPRTLKFDRAGLEAIGSGFLQTATPWTDGRPVFRGVLARDLLTAVKAEGTMVRAIALNDYRYDIPLSDFEDYPVLIAYEMNGEPLSVRDKGPLWIVYPLDQYSELQNSTTRRKMVWQLEELQIR